MRQGAQDHRGAGPAPGHGGPLRARGAAKNANGKRLATQQSVNAAVKAICDIMRWSNCAGALQYGLELTWIRFLRILGEREARERQEAEAVAVGVDFTPSFEAPYRWQDWAAPTGCPPEQHQMEPTSRRRWRSREIR